MSGTCSTAGAQTAVPIGRMAFLRANPRPGKGFLETCVELGAARTSQGRRWGWDGASLESASAFSHDPISYLAGMNLYEYVNDRPTNGTDPSGHGGWGEFVGQCQTCEIHGYNNNFVLCQSVNPPPPVNLPPAVHGVQVCCEPTDAAGTAIGVMAAAVFGIEHCWIRTSTVEAGMGPAPGLNPSSPIGGPTQITDHSGEGNKPGAHCYTLSDCDEGCVAKALVIGQSTGPWGPHNNCNTVIENILKTCKCHNKCLETSLRPVGGLGMPIMWCPVCTKKEVPNLPLF